MMTSLCFARPILGFMRNVDHSLQNVKNYVSIKMHRFERGSDIFEYIQEKINSNWKIKYVFGERKVSLNLMRERLNYLLRHRKTKKYIHVKMPIFLRNISNE